MMPLAMMSAPLAVAAPLNIFHHGLEGLDDFALCDILRRPLDLIALQILRVVDGNGDSAVVCRDVLQGCIQKHIAHHQLAVRGHILECKGATFGSPSAQVARSHIPLFSSLTTFSFSITVPPYILSSMARLLCLS